MKGKKELKAEIKELTRLINHKDVQLAPSRAEKRQEKAEKDTIRLRMEVLALYDNGKL